MRSAIHPRHHARLNRAVTALQADPPRTRTALAELRKIFEGSGERPPAILIACAALLKTDTVISGEILTAVRDAHAEWAIYNDEDRAFFRQCVYTTSTRRDVAVTNAEDITVMLRQAPPRITDARAALRWLDAITVSAHRALYTVCATLLSHPSADHPDIVAAIHAGHRMWPTLDGEHRALLTACIYASKARADLARRRTAERERAREAASADIHRCGTCDGNLAATPELPYCSESCRHAAEAAQRPTVDTHTATPATPARETAEQRAQRDYITGEAEHEVETYYFQVLAGIPAAGRVRKDERGVDAYDEERARHLDVDTSRQYDDGTTGRDLSFEDYEIMALRACDPAALCVTCHLERTPTERRSSPDARCETCRERGITPGAPRALATVA